MKYYLCYLDHEAIQFFDSPQPRGGYSRTKLAALKKLQRTVTNHISESFRCINEDMDSIEKDRKTLSIIESYKPGRNRKTQ